MTYNEDRPTSKTCCEKHWKWWLALMAVAFCAAVAVGVMGVEHVFASESHQDDGPHMATGQVHCEHRKHPPTRSSSVNS